MFFFVTEPRKSIYILLIYIELDETTNLPLLKVDHFWYQFDGQM